MKAFHVLVLERDPARREALVHMLRERGHQPVLAADTEAAAQALGVPGLDFFLMDLEMPGVEAAALRKLLVPAETGPPEPLDDAERAHISRALRYTKGNKRRTAHLLGIARSTLLAKVRRYGLESSDDGALSSEGS